MLSLHGQALQGYPGMPTDATANQSLQRSHLSPGFGGTSLFEEVLGMLQQFRADEPKREILQMGISG